jgi:hypothetical protein
MTNQDPRTLSLCVTFSVYVYTVMSDADEEDLASHTLHTVHTFETKLVIQLTVYTLNKVTASSGKSKKKTESKAKKTKETTFTLSSNNHLEFLQCLLTKHGQSTTYKVTERKRFSFRYLYPVSKAYVTFASGFKIFTYL